MNDSEETIKTEDAAPEVPAADEVTDPYVGTQEGYEEPYLEPIEEEVKYVYQKGDFWAFLFAALRVFVPILFLFFGGIMLVVWFFSR